MVCKVHTGALLYHTLYVNVSTLEGRVAIAKKKLSYEVIFLHYVICLPMIHVVLHVYLTTKTLQVHLIRRNAQTTCAHTKERGGASQ